MRDYPPLSNYASMLSSPQGIRLAFRDKGLQAAAVEVDKLGMPRARSGAFAVVYRMNLPGGSSKAIRLFVKEEDDRQDRYKRIFEHLSRLSLPCLVPFAYEDNAFRAADGKKYPMMTMDWVVGETLYDWLQGRALAGDGKALAVIAEKWRHTVKGLRDAKIAHGDLQHANVMVTRTGDIKLVDYDGMCVPSLVGRRNLEIGVDPYQHPGRNGDTQLSLGLDNFSALFIYVGLRALAADPRLWNDFVVVKHYDKMMLTRQDLEQPGKSPLIQRMKRSADAEVQRLTGTLLDVFKGRIDQVPCLEDLFVTFDFRQVGAALDRKDFDAAVGMLARSGKQVMQAPPDLQPRLRDAEQRVAKLTELLVAINAGDEEKTLAVSTSPLLQGYPGAASGLAVAKDAAAVLTVLKKLDAARRGKRWRDLVKEWDASQSLLTRPGGILRRSAESYREDIHLWRVRNELCDKILAMLKSPLPDSGELERLWLSLAGYGGHPECDGRKAAIQGMINARQKPPPTPVTPPSRPASPVKHAAASAKPPPPGPSRPAVVTPPALVSRWLTVAPPSPGGQPTRPPAPPPDPGSRPAVFAKRSGTAPAAAVASPSPRPSVPPPAAVPAHAGWSGQPVQGGITTVATPIPSGPAMVEPGPSSPDTSWGALGSWMAGRFARPRFDDAVFWAMLVCGWRSALGGFGGAIAGLGAAEGIAKANPPGMPFVQTTVLLSFLVTGIVMGFLHGRDAITVRPTFTMARWFFVVASAAVVATAAAVAALAFGTAVNDVRPLFLDLNTFSAVPAWAVLALGIVTTIGRVVPNITLGPLAFSGLLAAGLSVIAANAGPNPRTGILFGAIMLGVATAILVTVAEAVSRDWYLEYPGGGGRLARLNLGAVPVLAGTDPASCHVVRPGGSVPVAMKYWVDAGQPFVLDCAGSQPFRVSAGDRRSVAGLVLSVKSFAAEATRSAAAAFPSPGAPAHLSRETVGSRPALIRPAVVGTPVVAAPVASTVAVSAPPPPPPPPPPRPKC